MGGGTLKQLVTRQMLAPRAKDGYTNSQGLDICLEMARGLRYLHRSKPMVGVHLSLQQAAYLPQLYSRHHVPQ